MFAGAGSGKRASYHRVANLVAHARVTPYRILVTFTNRPRARCGSGSGIGPELVRDLWVGTFHATCAKLLRLYPEAELAQLRDLRFGG